MRSRTTTYLLVVLGIGIACAGTAQEQPLSVIDWVQQHPDAPHTTSIALPRAEPPVTPPGHIPSVEVAPLDGDAARLIGLVPENVSGLPHDMWRQAAPQSLSRQLARLPEFRLPAAQALLFRILLTEALSPGQDAADADLFSLARVDTLRRYGALDPAMAVLEQAGVTRDRAHFDAFMDLTLLTGQEWQACDILSAAPHLSPGLSERVFCAARQGEWALAALLFDAGRALEEIPDADRVALERFLDPELYEGARPLPRARAVTPLQFRLHEAIGEPLPTGPLPRAYAVADLRDLAGWKAQLEAAERLTVSGALPANRLLGLYSDRRPAASGGVWDRVRAVQNLDTALGTGSPEAVAKTLHTAWSAMQQAGLETTFAALFAPRLDQLPLAGDTAQLAETLSLLSPDYATAAAQSADPMLKALGVGDPAGLRVRGSTATAIVAGFAPDAGRKDLIARARQGHLGEVLLQTLVLLEEGAAGRSRAITQALGTLRALGFEDTARRASLQILLLERFG